MKKTSLLLAALLLSLAGWATAENPDELQDAETGGAALTLPDREARRAMSPEQRRAVLKAYKEARIEARRLGKVPSDGSYRPLAAPRAVDEPAGDVRVPGTAIRYDSGTVTGTGGQDAHMVGNRFDSALNPAGTMCCFPVEASGSITRLTFDMAITTTGYDTVWSVYSNVMGGTAMQVVSASSSFSPGLNTVNVSVPYMNGSFLAGIWQATATYTALGLDTGTFMGQGFHGISINDNPTGTGLVPLTTGGGMGVNAVFRVRGNVATPVELMHFEIEED